MTTWQTEDRRAEQQLEYLGVGVPFLFALTEPVAVVNCEKWVPSSVRNCGQADRRWSETTCDIYTD